MFRTKPDTERPIARQHVLEMGEDELRDEIRRLAGLETKSAREGFGGGALGRRHASAGAVAVHSEGENIAAAARAARLADLVIYGRTRRWKNPGGR